MCRESSEMVPMFFAGKRSHKGSPCGFLERNGAQQLVDAGKATWTNESHKALKLHRTEADKPRPSLSLLMGEVVTERAAAGSHYHKEIAASWQRPGRNAA